MKLKPNVFLKIADTLLSTKILAPSKIQRKILMFGEVGAPESYFRD